MAGKRGLLQYIGAAFNARPFGMFVAPNWIGLAAVGLLGLANPGVWVLGAGLELGYLLYFANNERFRRVVDARAQGSDKGSWDARISQALGELGDRDRKRYQAVAERCRSILDLQLGGASSLPQGVEAQHEGLGRLTWMYLRLLLSRHAIDRVLTDAGSPAGQDLPRALSTLEGRLRDPQINDDLRRSLDGQVDILKQRIQRRAEASQQMSVIDAELVRIEQQVELIREQAALSTDPDVLSRRIDEIAATLGGTSQWIRDQQQVLGGMEDLLTDVPPPTLDRRAKESQ